MSSSPAFLPLCYTRPLSIPRRLSISATAATRKTRPKPAVSVALFRRDPLSVLLVKRGKPPNKNLWALPGGSLEEHESLIHAAHRELQEETSISSHQAQLLPHPVERVLVPPQNPTYCISVFAGVYTAHLTPVADDDAADACFCQIEDISRLPTVPNLHTTIHAALKHIRHVDFTL